MPNGSNTLHLRLAREIVSLVRRENVPAGAHLTEAALARSVGTSRAPVTGALARLERLGVVRHAANRGYFLVRSGGTLANVEARLEPRGEDRVYREIARERLARTLPDTVNETTLMRRYRATRGAVRAALRRALAEGWVQRRPGYGWGFLPLIDSAEAYEESYAFRGYIEPEGLLAPTFRITPAILARLRQTQERIMDDGYRTMTPEDLFEVAREFHETLAACSGNRFILQSVQRLNQLRRLVEYGQAASRPPRRAHSVEHLAIIAALERGNRVRAAALLRRHLEDAQRDKSRAPALPAAFVGRAPSPSRRGKKTA